MCNIPSKVGFGRGYQVVIVDNYAFMTMKDKTTIYQNLVPTLLAMSHSELFISSVPNGDEHFKSLVEDENGMFDKHKIHWSDVPGRDNDWKLDRIKMCGSVEVFAQEYENLFTGTKEWNRYINLNKLLD